MSNLLAYKNYNGTVEYSKEDGCLFGKVTGIKSLLSYEGDSVRELEKDFQNVIDEYLRDCEEKGNSPIKELLMSESVLSFTALWQYMQWSMERA